MPSTDEICLEFQNQQNEEERESRATFYRSVHYQMPQFMYKLSARIDIYILAHEQILSEHTL